VRQFWRRHTYPRRLHWVACVVAALLLASCGGTVPQEAAAPPAVAHPPDAQRFTTVLAAGDASIQAFDNAIEYLRDILPDPKQEVYLLTTRRHRPAGMEIAATPTLLARLQALKPAAGGGCLIYLTSHGNRAGFYLAGSPDLLTPADLDRALDAGCGDAPTVMIVSACYSGQFAAPPMTRANRIILTAARADRTSFGCGAGFTFTYFDECVLGALPNAGDWHAVYERARSCVALREAQSGVAASEPQAFFGADVSNLPTPWRSKPSTDNERIQFTAATVVFKPALVPFSRSDRERQASELQQYAEAPSPKALAVTPGGFISVMTDDRSGRRSADDVARMALQRCEWLTGGACILFARNDQITELLPSGLPPFHPELLVRSGAIDRTAVPFIRDDQRPLIDEYLAQSGPKALAISPGHAEIGMSGGATMAAARLEALAQCRAGQRDCLIYAEDDRIVLGWGN
jgi:hypothetical protein